MVNHSRGVPCAMITHSTTWAACAKTPGDRSRCNNLKEVAAVVGPYSSFESGPGHNPGVDEGVFEKRLVARDQDPITMAIPFLRIAEVPDPQSLLGQLPG